MKKLLLLALLLSTNIIVFAQGDPGENPDISVPIDGGVLFVAAAGAAYAIKKLKASKSAQSAQSEESDEVK